MLCMFKEALKTCLDLLMIAYQYLLVFDLYSPITIKIIGKEFNPQSAILPASDNTFCDRGMPFYVKCLPADDLHKISSLIKFLKVYF